MNENDDGVGPNSYHLYVGKVLPPAEGGEQFTLTDPVRVDEGLPYLPGFSIDVAPDGTGVIAWDNGSGDGLSVMYLAPDGSPQGDVISVGSGDLFAGNPTVGFVENGDGEYEFAVVYQDGGTVYETTIDAYSPVWAADAAIEVDEKSAYIIDTGEWSGAEGYELTISSVDGAGTTGTVALNADGTITYDPASAFDHLNGDTQAEDTFSYTVRDGTGFEKTVTTTVTVTGVNDAPTADDKTIETMWVESDGPREINVTANDVDSPDDGLELVVVDPPAKGLVSMNEAGKLVFDPGEDFTHLPEGETEEISFTYQSVDPEGANSAPATVTLTVAGAAQPEDDGGVASDGQLLLENLGGGMQFHMLDDGSIHSIHYKGGSYYYQKFDSNLENQNEGYIIPFGDGFFTRNVADISVDESGNALIVWSKDSGYFDEKSIFMRVFDRDGNPLSDSTEIFESSDRGILHLGDTFYFNDDGFHLNYRVGGPRSGDFVQQFDLNGDEIGERFLINGALDPENIYTDHIPRIAKADGESFFLASTSRISNHGKGAFAAVNKHIPGGNDFELSNDFSNILSSPNAHSHFAKTTGDIEPLPNGEALVVWTSRAKIDPDDVRGTSVVHFRKVGTDGLPNSEILPVFHAASYDDQRHPDLAVGPDGRFAIMWEQGGMSMSVHSIKKDGQFPSLSY